MLAIVFLLRMVALVETNAFDSEQIHLVAVVEDEHGPMAGITIRVKGVGEGVSKAKTGEVNIPLSENQKVGDEAELLVTPDSWVIRNLYANKVIVPRPGVIVHLFLVRKGSRSLLSKERLLQLLTEVNTAVTPSSMPSSILNREVVINSIVEKRASEWGFPATELRRTIERRAANKTATDYERALISFYNGDYGGATKWLEGPQNDLKAKWVEATRMRGTSYFMLSEYGKAIKEYEKLIADDPDSLVPLSNLSVICGTQLMLVESARTPGCEKYTIARLRDSLARDQNNGHFDFAGEAQAINTMILARTMTFTRERDNDEFLPDQVIKRFELVPIARRLAERALESSDPNRFVYASVGASVWARQDYKEAQDFMKKVHERGLKANGGNTFSGESIVLSTIGDMVADYETAFAALPLFEKSLKLAQAAHEGETELYIQTHLVQHLQDDLFMPGWFMPGSRSRISEDERDIEEDNIESHFKDGLELTNRITLKTTSLLPILMFRDAYHDWLELNDRAQDAVNERTYDLALIEKVLSPASPTAISVRTGIAGELSNLADEYEDTGQLPALESTLRRWVKVLKTGPTVAGDDTNLNDVIQRLVDLLNREGKKAEAAKWRAETLQ